VALKTIEREFASIAVEIDIVSKGLLRETVAVVSRLRSWSNLKTSVVAPRAAPDET
jgi:hypothetical protein